MQISGSVALVTGANRGLGLAFARELVRRGAAKVYGAARDPAAVTEPGVLPVGLDITAAEQVAQVAAECADVSLLVNNAGVLRYSTFIGARPGWRCRPTTSARCACAGRSRRSWPRSAAVRSSTCWPPTSPTNSCPPSPPDGRPGPSYYPRARPPPD